MLERLIDCMREIRAAAHGQKSAIYGRFCRELGFIKPDGQPDQAKLMRLLAKQGLSTHRAGRCDKGEHALPLEEAMVISRWQRENSRANGKNLVSLEDAVKTLREAGLIQATSLDPKTGELKPLSLTAIRSAMRSYKLEEKVLNTPAPAMQLRAKYPNHVWQIDASLCVLYYLPADGGLAVMEEKLFNTNKPKNLKRIENERVWRYVVTDHASGSIYVEYVFGGETGANLCSVFIHCMQERAQEFWGVPEIVYCDAGAANTGAVFKGLCAQLGVRVLWHMPGNARATGSVEKAQDIVERKFESILASRPVHNLKDLNAYATFWRVKFNQAVVHGRHGLTRHMAWRTHVRGHLQAPPSRDTCLELAQTTLKERRVTQYLTVDFEGTAYDVSQYPEVYRGLKVEVCKNPWRSDSLRVALPMKDGLARWFLAPAKVTNELGYWEDSPVLGEAFKSHAQTGPEKALAKMAEQSQADQTTAKLRKPMPFGGSVDPFKPMATVDLPTPLPVKPSSEVQVSIQLAVTPKLSATKAAMLLARELGRSLDRAEFEWLNTRFAGGVPEEQVQELAKQLNGNLLTQEAEATGTHDAKPNRPHLRIVS
jgi:hypothetical protein